MGVVEGRVPFPVAGAVTGAFQGLLPAAVGVEEAEVLRVVLVFLEDQIQTICSKVMPFLCYYRTYQLYFSHWGFLALPNELCKIPTFDT